MLEHAPRLVGTITLGVGVGLLVRPQLATGPLGIAGREGDARLVGLADLVAGYGLLRRRPAWPWMAGRAAVNVAMLARAEGRRTFAVLTLLDGGTALTLYALDRQRNR
jgi:hypothetical protein